MNPKSYYQSQRNAFAATLTKLTALRNKITFIKVIDFILALTCAYQYMRQDQFGYLVGMAALVITFVILHRYESKLIEQAELTATRLKCYDAEINYLNDNLSDFDEGNEYIEAQHPYAVDLDIFGRSSLFQEMNRTITTGGKHLLANILTNPITDTVEIIERQKATQELSDTIDWIEEFRAKGISFRTNQAVSDPDPEWDSSKSIRFSGFAKGLIFASNILFFALIVASLFYPRLLTIVAMYYIMQLFVSLSFSKRIELIQNRLTRFVGANVNFYRLVQMIQEKEFETTKLKQIYNQLFEQGNALAAFKEVKSIMDKFDNRGNVIVLFGLNGCYMRDLHIMLQLQRLEAKQLQQIPAWVKAVNELDALISMAIYRFNHPEYCTPVIDTTTIVSAHEMAHPLLKGEQVVTNNFTLEQLHEYFVVTGANMAGKSTFLRSVGVNMVLALTGNVVRATTFHFTPIQLFTSMRTTDNLAGGISYFHAELLRLKKLVDAASAGNPLFIILDEMLKGTNSTDKLNGSIRFLEKIRTLPLCGLIATHDLALGELSTKYPTEFHNICFEIEHTNEVISYDYKLKPGVSRNMNASILLKQMGLID